MNGNKIYNLTKKKFAVLNKDKKEENCYVVELNGKQVQDKNVFFQTMKEHFELPDVSGWDSLIDWMTDLSWIDKNCFQIIIYDYAEFLKNDEKSKELFFEIFQEDILPFWEKEVLETIVDGKVKSFNLYLIND